MAAGKRRHGSRPVAGLGCESQLVQFIPPLRAFARALYRDIDNADDLVQETLTRALSALDTFEPGTNMKPWLFTIMRNAFYTRFKLAAREAPGLADCISSIPAVHASQEWGIRGSEIMRAVQRLPPSQREVIVLIGMLGESYEDTAEICDCAIGTIKSRLNRARRALLAELQEASVESSFERDGEAMVLLDQMN
jgi:RNA polymerase sigma factor (sigma-70 family)